MLIKNIKNNKKQSKKNLSITFKLRKVNTLIYNNENKTHFTISIILS